MRRLLPLLLLVFVLTGCQTPLHTWEYQSRNHALYNEQLLDNLDRIEQGEPRVFFVGLALWGGERWASGDIQRMSDITARLYPAFRPVRFFFSNEAIIAPGNLPSFDEMMLDKSIDLIRATAGPRDLVVIAVSTHGQPGRLSNKVGTVQRKPIDTGFMAQRLRKLSQVNVLLIISACYSGSFAEALKNDGFERVLVITSARTDRTSFGCSPAETSTWFVQALSQAVGELSVGGRPPNWSQVMGRARQLVSQWEQSRSLVASVPQIWIAERADRELLNY